MAGTGPGMLLMRGDPEALLDDEATRVLSPLAEMRGDAIEGTPALASVDGSRIRELRRGVMLPEMSRRGVPVRATSAIDISYRSDTLVNVKFCKLRLCSDGARGTPVPAAAAAADAPSFGELGGIGALALEPDVPTPDSVPTPGVLEREESVERAPPTTTTGGGVSSGEPTDNTTLSALVPKTTQSRCEHSLRKHQYTRTHKPHTHICTHKPHAHTRTSTHTTHIHTLSTHKPHTHIRTSTHAHKPHTHTRTSTHQATCTQTTYTLAQVLTQATYIHSHAQALLSAHQATHMPHKWTHLSQ